MARVKNPATQEDRLVLGEGEDLRRVYDSQLSKVPWVVEEDGGDRGWLAEGDVCFFAGRGASMKSFVALNLALAATLGEPWLGKYGVRGINRVAYLDEEMKERTFLRRFQRLYNGVATDKSQDIFTSQALRYYLRPRVNLTNRADIRELDRVVAGEGINLLILDSFVRMIRGADESSNREMSSLYDDALAPLARENNCTVLILHHFAKQQANDTRPQGDAMRGAGDLRNCADQVWIAHKTKSGLIKLVHDKCREGVECDTLTIKAVDHEDSLALVLASVAVATEDKHGFVLELLRSSNEISRKDLLAGLDKRFVNTADAHQTLLSRIMNGLVKEGKVEERRDGVQKVYRWKG